jgi:hypothetical protein
MTRYGVQHTTTWASSGINESGSTLSAIRRGENFEEHAGDVGQGLDVDPAVVCV